MRRAGRAGTRPTPSLRPGYPEALEAFVRAGLTLDHIHMMSLGRLRHRLDVDLSGSGLLDHSLRARRTPRFTPEEGIWAEVSCSSGEFDERPAVSGMAEQAICSRQPVDQRSPFVSPKSFSRSGAISASGLRRMSPK